MPVALFKVKAVYEYKSAEPDDLKFPNGQIITVTAEEDDDWYSGEYVSSAGEKLEGIFPKNFVEKYEPEIPLRPSRPARPKKDAEPAAAAASTPAPADETPVPAVVEEPVREAEIAPNFSAKDGASESTVPPATTKPAQAPVQRSVSSANPKSPPPPKPATSKPPPPQVAEKPDVGSFKDRMAMFNKVAAVPVAPFKPGAQGSGGFVRKPFVAPPPSKNAYVPPPRDIPPPKAYRREDDPTMPAEHAAEPVPTTNQAADPEAPVDEEQLKPTSLKERIALLQKQQMEQARRAEGGVKKEKPKKPAKRQAEPEESMEASDAVPRPSLDRVASNDTVGKKSVDFADDESGPLRGPSNRQPSGHHAMATPPQPSRELVSDTNDADDSGAGDTEEAQETSTEEERPNPRLLPVGSPPSAYPRAEAQSTQDEADKEEADDGADEDEEEEDVDPEVKRRMEIRERMAKMSGGMGMMGMFGPPGGMPSAGASRKPKPSGDGDRYVSSGYEQDDTTTRAPPVPIMALPGMSRTKSPEAEEEMDSDTEDGPSRATPRNAMEPEEPQLPAPPKRSSTDRAAPPVPPERAVPPPPPRDTGGAPMPPPRSNTVPDSPASPSEIRPTAPTPRRMDRPLRPGEDSDDERSLRDSRPQSKEGPSVPTNAPPVPSSRPTNMSIDTASPISSTDKRASRGAPPIPMSSPTMASPQSRAPPPPPPGQPPSRRSTNDSHGMTATKHQIEDDSEEEVTEYDGDYDTDIASSAKHKDALKSHGRDSSLDESTLTDDGASKPPATSPPSRPVPPLPPTSVPRDVPPPPPQGAPKPRQSADMPRAAPPPIPPPKQALDDDYDPYRYTAPDRGLSSPQIRPAPPVLQSPSEEVEEDDLYNASPVVTRTMVSPPAAERVVPPAPPPSAAPVPQPAFAAPSQSLDINRTKSQSARRSMEQSRPAGDQGFIASDVDVSQNSYWWVQDNIPPPVLQNRNDILYEIEAQTSTKRGGKATVAKDVYVLYMDYSQSTITANFDASEPHNVSFEQRHQRPPPPPRQDQLEMASSEYGARIAEAAHAKQNSTVGDGAPHALVLDLIKPLASKGVLRPIGTRAYGALVYANLANATTQQFDEIRPGDIATFRNAKFAGHKGTMHAKYATEAGKPGQDHVGVVLDWDGTKKKIRVWEQGRDKDGKKGGSSKVKEDSYKVGDLRSGEVRVWRVMGRNWVGWDKS